MIAMKGFLLNMLQQDKVIERMACFIFDCHTKVDQAGEGQGGVGGDTLIKTCQNIITP